MKLLNVNVTQPENAKVTRDVCGTFASTLLPIITAWNIILTLAFIYISVAAKNNKYSFSFVLQFYSSSCKAGFQSFVHSFALPPSSYLEFNQNFQIPQAPLFSTFVCFLHLCRFTTASSVTRLGDLFHFGQLFKAGGNNYFAQIAHIFDKFSKGVKIFLFSSGIIFGQLLKTFVDFLLVALTKSLITAITSRWLRGYFEE